MTMMDTGVSTPVEFSGGASWHRVDDGFWVGNAGGVFLGTVEQHTENRFSARGATRAYVGEYRTVDAAIDAIRTHSPLQRSTVIRVARR